MAETKLQVMSHRGPRADDETEAAAARRRGRPRRRERIHLPGPPSAVVVGGARRRQRPGTGPRREGPGPRSPRQRLDVPRRPHRAARRHRPPYDGSAGAGAGKGSPASSSTWPESTPTAPITRSANGRTWRRCSAGVPDRWRAAGRTRRQRSLREPSRRRSTSSRCGDGSPARPSWPVPPWACSPTGTGRRSDEDGAQMTAALESTWTSFVWSARSASSSRRTTTSTTRSSPTAGGRPRHAGSPGTCRSAISAAGRTARPDRTPASATVGRGSGTTTPPTRGSCPTGRSTRDYSSHPGPNATCATSSGPMASVSGSWSR